MTRGTKIIMSILAGFAASMGVLLTYVLGNEIFGFNPMPNSAVMAGIILFLLPTVFAASYTHHERIMKWMEKR